MKLREFIDSYPLPPHSSVLHVNIELDDGRPAYRLVLQPYAQVKAARKQNEEGNAGRPIYGAVTGATLEIYPAPSLNGKLDIAIIPPVQVI